MEPGTQRWWFRRSLAWAEAQAATENHLIVDFGGRQRPDEKFGLSNRVNTEQKTWMSELFNVPHMSIFEVICYELTTVAKSPTYYADLK